jgi:ABC-type sugar transport system substrate-binding protein
MKSKPAVFAALLVVASAFAAVAPNAVASSQAKVSSSQAKHKTLGIVEITTTDLSTVQFVRGATKSAEKAGWTVLTTDAEGEPSKAIAAMEDYVARGVTAIVTTVFVSSSLEVGIKAARAAHIPVISWAGGLAPGISADFAANAGDVVTKALLKAMGGKNKGSILDFTYHPGLPCLLRGNDFNTVMKGYSNIKVYRHELEIQNVPVDSESTAAAWLLTSPKTPIGVFGCYDDPAIGAISALKELGYKAGQVKVFGFNAEAPALAAIKSGWMTGSMYFNSIGGGPVVFATIQKILAAGSSWRQEELQIPHILVTRANVAAFEAKYGDI